MTALPSATLPHLLAVLAAPLWPGLAVAVRLVLLFLIALIAARIYLARPKLPPGPWGLPICGFLPFLGKEFHLTLTRLGQRFGPIYQLHLGSKRLVVIGDARIVREAFRRPEFSGRPDTELTRILQGYGT